MSNVPLLTADEKQLLHDAGFTSAGNVYVGFSLYASTHRHTKKTVWLAHLHTSCKWREFHDTNTPHPSLIALLAALKLQGVI